MNAVPPSGPFFKRTTEAGAADQRFCFFHAPATTHDGSDVPYRGCVLAVHAFAEEMNKTRAVAADGARALAAAGFAVLQIDLCGCGDSGGEFEDATWTGWIADLDEAWAWMEAHCAGPRWVWGTRLGALLADQFSITCEPVADGLLLWQPVVNGAQHLGQFLRLKTVGNLLREAASGPAAASAAPVSASTPVARVAQPSPRADLAAGQAIEVAGYRLTPVLADAIEACRLGARERADAGPVPRVRWFEVSSQPTPSITPVSAKVIERWTAAGSDVAVVHVAGNAFWQTLEIERCDALVEATVEALCA